ncbi:T9SS type A sorting domain-containing protein [Pontibacter lucknowensis]|uniref:Por secretion system C-terminal sorting domain-containing protein n=1 Tax=Pontibacter lucknowensis TaxID=1077936 RepID=A0A1N6Z938_9BACT|nr:T9SS type A sorting domain-containing protein [Pontibacter lucknowensis]SIR23323.1 Por secretion system C-terminal sorting domain-containing protein [Pontibacter lucknowensis]
MGIRQFLFTLVLLCCGSLVSAQGVLMPLQQDPQRIPAGNPYQLRTESNHLSLPFFDDFSGATTTPDPAYWINGGVYVNNRFALRPLTRNAATFDGLNAQGNPYGSNIGGPTDTLTSQPIRLAGLTPADSVYLSFYWQSGGQGSAPERNNNNPRLLRLEFKESNGTWTQVWQQTAPGQVTEFAQAWVAVREQRFMHDEFQFRFRTEGTRNSIRDIWNLDYVELDRNRRRGQNTTRDIGISESVSPLMDYSAVPARQFLANPGLYLRDEISASLNNLGDLPGAIAWRAFIQQVGVTPADTFLREEALIPGQARQRQITATPRISNLNLNPEGFVLQHGFWLDTKEQNARQRANDSTLQRTTFSDYFALDDGTAEAGYSSLYTYGNTQVAQRFELATADQVRAFRVHFPQVGVRHNNVSIVFRIWADDNGRPGRTLHEQSFPVQQNEGLNTFYEIELSQPVPVEGTFYVGFSQPATLYLNIGFDRNAGATGRLFYNTVVGGWQRDSVNAGAVMLRPVMAGQALGLEEEARDADLQVYPNPSNGILHFSGPYRSFSMYDVTGREILRHKATVWQEPVRLPKLSPGLYTIRIETDHHTFTTKRILINL